MDENGAQESGMDFYAQFNSLKALEKKFLKSNQPFFLAVQSPAGQVSLIVLNWLAGLCTAKENRWLDFKNFFSNALRLLN